VVGSGKSRAHLGTYTINFHHSPPGQILRPQLATFNVTNGLLHKLKIIKPIAWGWNLPGKNLRVEDHFVDAAPHNGTRDDTTVRLSLSFCISNQPL